MTLLNLCQKTISLASKSLPKEHKLGTRLICPEYSKSVQEVKTYPFLEQDRLFALCWNINDTNRIDATLYPAPESFVYHYNYVPGEKTQLHTHDYIELAYIVDGEFQQNILGKNITFQSGELCLIDKNCLHQDCLEQCSTTILFLGIANDMFTEIIDEAVTTEKIISFLQSALLKQKNLQQFLHFKPTGTARCEIEAYLTQLLEELIAPNIGTHYICKGLLLRIFRLLSTKYDFSLSKEQRKTMNWIVFEEISDYIKDHYATITIQDLVHVFHFQEDYFNRLIKAKTGLTYSSYVQQIRLERAEYLLLHSHASIDEITNMVGYHNKGYFYKIFQEKYGTTPSKYRKQKKSSHKPYTGRDSR